MSFRIGPYEFANPLVLAPMAGVTDRPFRQLCRSLGAGMTVSEMVSSKPELRNTRKSRLRLDHRGEPGPIIVQIAGADPQMMADAARFNVEHGAQIIDINMGCPAKKVCRVEAGSALMRDESRVEKILRAVVAAVDVPVTLKTRTGWSKQHKNAVRIAQIAEVCGIQALTVHGRTREDKFNGEAEYDTIRLVKQHVKIPIVANGDIDQVKKAQTVMDITGADAIMIGRAAQKRPWIFQHINHYLETGQISKDPDLSQKQEWLIAHLNRLYDFYGEDSGIRIARKHIGWQIGETSLYRAFKTPLMTCQSSVEQIDLVVEYFTQLQQEQFRLAC